MRKKPGVTTVSVPSRSYKTPFMMPMSIILSVDVPMTVIHKVDAYLNVILYISSSRLSNRASLLYQKEVEQQSNVKTVLFSVAVTILNG